MCVCEGEKESARQSVCVCAYVCERVKEREREKRDTSGMLSRLQASGFTVVKAMDSLAEHQTSPSTSFFSLSHLSLTSHSFSKTTPGSRCLPSRDWSPPQMNTFAPPHVPVPSAVSLCCAAQTTCHHRSYIRVCESGMEHMFELVLFDTLLLALAFKKPRRPPLLCLLLSV